ncbi:uncharacterized protein LOC111021601 isoform X1 [Momordica charantia]|uniref:Uncharacterized protein LOC111021601 isoform X1 n=1 Tax=Momordica charantia TaxID=3673 RepID=A0A6J1DJ93_MOMCH|nr:uncharacterized protein LOC111021601 isoform X1 [Momordica charantia]
MNLETWKKQSTRQKNELWHSIQARYNIHEAWQKKYFFEKISGLWRESKSQLERLDQNTSHEGMSTNTNVVDDAIGKVLGHDHGYVRGYGHGVTKSKFLSMSQKDNTITFFPEECDRMTSEMTELKYLVSSLLADKAKSSEQNSNHTGNVPTSAHVPPANLSSPPSVTINDNAPRKCMLLDWIGSGKVIAEGRWSSNDPSVLVHHIPLGPNVVRVWVDTVKKPNSYLWRPTSDMMVIDNALGTTIAWPADKVKI